VNLLTVNYSQSNRGDDSNSKYDHRNESSSLMFPEATECDETCNNVHKQRGKQDP